MFTNFHFALIGAATSCFAPDSGTTFNSDVTIGDLGSLYISVVGPAFPFICTAPYCTYTINFSIRLLAKIYPSDGHLSWLSPLSVWEADCKAGGAYFRQKRHSSTTGAVFLDPIVTYSHRGRIIRAVMEKWWKNLDAYVIFIAIVMDYLQICVNVS